MGRGPDCTPRSFPQLSPLSPHAALSRPCLGGGSTTGCSQPSLLPGLSMTCRYRALPACAGRPARLRLSPCLSLLLSLLQPLPHLSGASPVPWAWGLPTQAHVGGLSSLGGALTQLFSPRQSPDFAEEPRSSEPPPSPGELPSQTRGLHPGCLVPLTSLPPLPLPGLQEEDGEVAMVLLGRPSPDAMGPEEVTLCSSRRPMRPGRRGLGPVPS